MARKIVDIGVAGNDGTGDSIREAFRKTNENFSELYAVFGQGGFLKFTDLSDTPDTLVSEANKIPVVNSIGNAIVLKDIISPLGTISVTQDGDSLKLDTLSSRLVDDPLPKMAYSLDARNQLIGGLRSPINDIDFETARNVFNTDHTTNYSIDSFAINKGYADAKYVNVSGDTMFGHLNVPANASGTQVPRASEVVLKTGATMTGTLTLDDHPGGLAGSGTPNGPDDLQAVTKYYVDNSAYSSRVNLFVSTQGDDSQTRTPPGKEGRDRSYAYASINRACQKAEELVNSAPWETGPYRQLIAYNDGEAYSEVTRIEPGLSGTTRVFFSNFGGNRVDQGRLPQPDIVSGKLVVGRNSGAKGFIYQYYGPDGSSGIGEDYFDLQDVEGEFELGENLEFGQAVRDIQISIFVESGSYYEDYPIRIPANTAVVGDELRRCLIRPADRPSRSPWVDVWFRRDLTFDGLTLTSTEYGYHYLTDPSDPLSEPKNNRDIDVFLCNDATIIRQITCQGHGGFMMVLDPEGQILTKSAYIQQSGSFSGSVNKQAFRGGQYVDGFAGNIAMDIQSKINDLEFLVTGSERAPTTPCSFVVDGRRFKVDAYTDDGTGYGNARQLIRRNIEFIKAEVIGYIDSELSPAFTFNRTTCARDVGLIIDALGWDLAIGTNFNSVRAGQAYFRGTQYDILPDQISQTNDALTYTKNLISDILASNSIAQTRATSGVDELLDIINNGVGNSDTISFPEVVGTTPTSVLNSRDLLLANIDFLREEGIAYISETYPTFIYDEDKCRRDTQYIIEAVIYDLMYGGNSATVEAGAQYYDGNGNLQIPGQTLQTTDALNYISSIAQDVVQSISIPFPKQTNVTQTLNLSNSGTSAEASLIEGYMDDINAIILGGPSAIPTITYPPLTGVDSSLTDSKALLLANKESLKSSTVTYLDQRYSYNKTTCARDTGYIADAIAHDIYYGGDLKTVQAGLAYFNASASSKIVIDTQLQNTLDAIDRIETVILAVINNVSPAQRYQQEVIQYINTDYTQPAASTKIGQLFDILTDILDNPPNARDAKELLAANKEFIKAEVIAYLDNKYVSFSYDQAKCERDVGYVIDALGYDLMFASDYQSIIAGRAYWRGTASVAVGAQQAATIDAYEYLKTLVLAIVSGNATASASVSANMDTIIDIVTNGISAVPTSYVIPTPTGGSNNASNSGYLNARNMIEANREFVKAEVIQYITNNYVGLSYDPNKCRRDIDYILDSTFYDLTYGGNLATEISARAYYEGIYYRASGVGPTATIVSITSDVATTLGNHGLDLDDTVISTVTTNGLTAGTTYYVVDVPSSNSFKLSTSLGGAAETLVNGIGLEILTYTVNEEERAATIAAYGFMKDLVGDIALDSTVTPLQVVVSQVRSGGGLLPGSTAASNAAESQVQHVITVVTSGTSAAPAQVIPDLTWVSAPLVAARNSLVSAKAATATSVTSFINANYGSGFSYDVATCARDVGFIVGNVSSDLLYGGTYLTIRAAQRYHIGTARTRIVLGEQLAETIDGIEYAAYLAQQVLAQQAPTINFQTATGVSNPVTQVFDSSLNGSSQVTRLGELMDLIVEIIQDPNVDVTTIVSDAEPITYPTYRLILSDTTPITNPLEFTITGYVSSVDSGVGDGSYDVTFTIPSYTPDPLTKTRYRIYGNSNNLFNNDSVECVASTSTSMTLRYAYDPTTGGTTPWGSGTTKIEYVKNFMLLAAGNTSMCSNDFTQINDVGYGLVATNLGLIETVSVFSYYCWTAYYANNGGQIRSLNGSNAHGEYGIISEGSDPLEIPDSANLADNMIQVARVFKEDNFATSNAKDELAIYIYEYDYAPYNVSECEINHGSGVITALNSTFNGGSGYTNGTYIDVPLTGGTGNGATANIVVSGGSIVTVGLTQGGIRYTDGDILSVDDADVGGGGGSLFSIAVDNVIGNGIVRYEVAGVTDVSNLNPTTVTDSVASPPTVTGPNVDGKFEVTFSFAATNYIPLNNVPYTVSGNDNDDYNGVHEAIAASTTSVTLLYDEDPGVYATGTTQLWGRGNIIRLNINTGGNNDTAVNGLETDLDHDQVIVIRSSQNFKFYEVGDTNPIRPSTALTFVGDPNPAEAIVYRVLAYGQKGPLNEDLAADEAILGFDTTYDYIKLLVSNTATTTADPDDGAKTMGATAGDLKIALERVNETSVENRLNSGEMIIAWDGKIHRVLSYTDMGLVLDYAYIEIEDIVDKCLSGTTTTPGIYTPVDPDFNLDISEPPTIRAGLSSVEPCEIIVNISTCRVTGHDFLDIGTGSYNQTNFPGKIYGAPREPNQAKEVTERTRGRCFYVTTDQDGIFRVGRFFTVDQGTGRVTFAASIALSNLDGLGFKRGVTVSEFSNDDTFTDGANDALPTEAATQGYIDRRLGMDRTNLALPGTSLIGPGYMDRAGILEFSGPDPLNMGGFRIANLGDPIVATDAATKDYVDVQELSNVRVDTSTTPARTVNDMLVYNGTKWVNANTSTIGDIQVSLATGTKNVALNIKNDVIINSDVHAPVDDTEFGTMAIVQSKLNMNKAGTIAAAPTGTEQNKQSQLGVAAFKSTEFTATDGWIELQTSSSATTGVKPEKLAYIGNGTLLGNRSGSATHPYEVTPAQVVSDGDGIKNASFAPTSVGTNGRAMILTGITPNTYSTTNISTTGEVSSIVRTDASGVADVQQLKIDGYKTLDTSSTTLEQYTPGAVKFLTAVGTTNANTIITTVGTLNVNAISSASTTTFSPANANVTLSPSGTGTVTINPNSVGTINNINIGTSTRGTGAFTTLTANSSVTFTANTASTSTTTGTLVVTGGIGASGNVNVGGTMTVNGSGTLKDVSGNYGSIEIDGGATGGYEGYSIGGRAVFMHNNANATGLYNDVDNEWLIQCTHNAGVDLYYNGASKLTTTNTGITVTGSISGALSGNASTATTLQTARNINGVSFNGSANITVEPYVERDDSSNANRYITFVDDSTAAHKRLNMDTNLYYNPSTNLLYTTATSARYADLAEKYMGDAVYEAGTVVVFGGEQEVTVTNVKGDHRVAGIISAQPSYIMNGDLDGETALMVGLTGRLPCKVLGKVQKGDILVTAAKAGYAIVNNDPKPGTIVGKALENKEDLGDGVIEVVVGRF